MKKESLEERQFRKRAQAMAKEKESNGKGGGGVVKRLFPDVCSPSLLLPLPFATFSSPLSFLLPLLYFDFSHINLIVAYGLFHDFANVQHRACYI